MVANLIINNVECCYVVTMRDILKLDNYLQPKHCLQKEALHIHFPVLSPSDYFSHDTFTKHSLAAIWLKCSQLSIQEYLN